jgi:hypothetical protein
MVQRGWFYHHRVTKPSLCSRYDKDRLHMFPFKPFKYNFPPKAQMVDNPGNWGHYVDKKCPFTGPQPRLMVWGSTTWKSQKKTMVYFIMCDLWYTLHIIQMSCILWFCMVYIICLLWYRHMVYSMVLYVMYWCVFPMIYNIH